MILCLVEKLQSTYPSVDKESARTNKKKRFNKNNKRHWKKNHPINYS